jgi:HEAT repeat protein
VPVLIDCLNDKDLYVAQGAARALGEMRMEPDLVVPALANSLKDPRAEVREWVVRALGGYRERGVPALLEAQAGASNEFRTLIDETLAYIATKGSKTNAVGEVLTNGVKEF